MWSRYSIYYKRHNFTALPTSIPMEEIIIQIETAIFHLPPEVGNDIRQRSANIHHKAKLSRQNLSRDKRQVIRNLKQKDNILILPADKDSS